MFEALKFTSGLISGLAGVGAVAAAMVAGCCCSTIFRETHPVTAENAIAIVKAMSRFFIGLALSGTRLTSGADYVPCP